MTREILCKDYLTHFLILLFEKPKDSKPIWWGLSSISASTGPQDIFRDQIIENGETFCKQITLFSIKKISHTFGMMFCTLKVDTSCFRDVCSIKL